MAGSPRSPLGSRIPFTKKTTTASLRQADADADRAYNRTREMSDATRVVVPHCGHIPHIEHPVQFLEAFVPFLVTSGGPA
jgi:pimeloyl-ACP methyl ester carboxylesterase